VFLIKHGSSYLITRNKNTHVKAGVYYSCLVIHSHRLQRLFYPRKGVRVITISLPYKNFVLEIQ
jgi:hypothetical protein